MPRNANDAEHHGKFQVWLQAGSFQGKARDGAAVRAERRLVVFIGAAAAGERAVREAGATRNHNSHSDLGSAACSEGAT